MTKRTVASLGVLALTLTLTVAPAFPASAATTPVQYATSVHGDDADVYAPANRTNLPVALLLQGANVDKSHYSAFARAVANLGFVVVVPNHRRTVLGQTGLYTETAQAGWTVEWMRAEDQRQDSPLRDRIDERSLVLLGHSFGGATGLTLTTGACAPPFCAEPATLPAEVKGAALYGTNNAPRGGGEHPPVPNAVPVALIQGTVDGVGAPAAATATYNAIQRPPKMLVSVTGANHYGLTNGQNPAGALPDPSPQALDQTASVQASARWSGMFLRTALGDRWAATWLYGIGDAVDKDVTVTYTR